MDMWLLIVLFVSHFLGDFSHLSTTRMLKAKAAGRPIFPIFCHAFVHALLVFACLTLFGIEPILVLYMFGFRLGTHFGIDVLKGQLNIWFPSVKNPMSRRHWYIFGADQFLHGVVLILIAARVAQGA